MSGLPDLTQEELLDAMEDVEAWRQCPLGAPERELHHAERNATRSLDDRLEFLHLIHLPRDTDPPRR